MTIVFINKTNNVNYIQISELASWRFYSGKCWLDTTNLLVS